MNVYINKRTGGYSGGLAVVAARSEAEAQGILSQNIEGAEYCYDPNSWQKLDDVEANVTEPKLLAEDGYTE